MRCRNFCAHAAKRFAPRDRKREAKVRSQRGYTFVHNDKTWSRMRAGGCEMHPPLACDSRFNYLTRQHINDRRRATSSRDGKSGANLATRIGPNEPARKTVIAWKRVWKISGKWRGRQWNRSVVSLSSSVARSNVKKLILVPVTILIIRL